VKDGARVSISTPGHGRTAGTHDGEAGFPAPTGAFTVRVSRALSAEGSSLAPAERDLEPSTEPIEFRLDPGVEISGVVVDAAGSPVGGVEVEAYPASAERGFHLDREADAQAVTGSDGSFRLRSLASEPYTVDAGRVPPGLVPPPAITANGGAKDVRIVLSKAAEVLLTILDWSDRPLEGAKVVVQTEHSRGPGLHMLVDAFLDVSGADGRVVVRGIDPSRKFRLQIEPPLSRNDLVPMDEHERTLVAGERIVLARGYGAAVRVLDENDRGVVATLWHVGGTWEMGEVWEKSVGTSAHDGTAFLRGLPYGPVTLAASAGTTGLGDKGERVTVTPESPKATLRLAGEPRVLRFHVDGISKQRRGSLTRELADGRRGAALDFVVSQDGTVEVSGSRPGRYTVWIPTIGGDDSCVFAEDVEMGTSAAPTLKAARSRPIRIRLRVPDGSNVTQFDAVGPLGRPHPALDMGDGSHEIRGLPPGKWKVTCKVRAPTAWLRASVEAEAGTEIELEPK
jgi:hypothetical protein